MKTEEEIVELIRELPADKQEEILAHAQQLRTQSNAVKVPRKSGRGLWADLGIDVTDEDIDEVRREMWKNFPREDV